MRAATPFVSTQHNMCSAPSIHVAYSCPATRASVISEFTPSKFQCSSQGSLHALGISAALSDNRRTSCLAFHLCTHSHGPVSSGEHGEAILGKRHTRWSVEHSAVWKKEHLSPLIQPGPSLPGGDMTERRLSLRLSTTSCHWANISWRIQGYLCPAKTERLSGPSTVITGHSSL